VAKRIGDPVLVRPSYVLGGRAMAIVYDEARLEGYVREAVSASPEHPCWSTASSRTPTRSTWTRWRTASACGSAGIMQHIEEAGIHSGDSAGVLPTYKISPAHLGHRSAKLHRAGWGLALDVRGLMNVQYAIKDGRCLRARGRTRAPSRTDAVRAARPPACRRRRWRPRSWQGRTLARAGA
jgi:carbamoyl-phosphate synthase large subunit